MQMWRAILAYSGLFPSEVPLSVHPLGRVTERHLEADCCGILDIQGGLHAG